MLARSLFTCTFFLLLSVSFGQGKEITNSLIWSERTFSSDYTSSVRSMNDGEHFSALENNTLVKYSYKDFSKSVGTIYDGKSLGEDRMGAYFFNSDESKLLAACGRKGIYRRSFTADYRVIDLKSGDATKLFDKGDQMLADFSPDGSKVAFVHENNIYFRNLETNEVSQITSDGEVNKIINGSSDWVYEEEFEITKCFYWSPDGSKIAYMKFDESGVRDFTMDYYRGDTYPSPYTFKYPKAGEDNSKISLHVYDLWTNKTTKVDFGDAEYLPRMKWTNNKNELVILTMNRHQNHLKYIMVDCATEKPSLRTIFEEKSETYVEVDNNLLFLKDGSGFLRTGESTGYRHIYKVSFEGEVQAVTSGEWDVADLKGVNEKDGRVFYTSYEEGAIYKHLYSIKLDGNKKVKLSTRQGTNDGRFSTGMKYYINYHSSAVTAPFISVHKSDGTQLTVLVDNKEFNEEMKAYNLSPKEFIKIKGAEHELNAWVIKPPNFDASKKYPVYFNIYNGPGVNTVTDSWSGGSTMYLHLLSQKGYIIISVDTRGTGHRGTAFKNSTYQQLGKYETEDMIAAAQEVQKWEYVDADRIGVMGWSYGGYMASLCMTKGADVFKMGIAVAPVTNWRWYDSIYTERYMRTPAENADGYDDNSPINHVDKLKGKFLIVHGSGDDNVHVQNSMEMIDEMVKKNKDFEMLIYTNKAHGISGGYTREHLFNKMLAFTLENL